MDFLRLAGLCVERNRSAAPHGGCSHLCSAVALFTLVGIAGEDDGDAPDLDAIVKADAGVANR